MISIEVRGYKQIGEHDFVAIAPIWAHEHSRGYGEYPCNHFRLRGKMARYTEMIDYQPWNPDNVFSEECWLEVRLYLICWSYDPQFGGWGCSARRSLNHLSGSTTQIHRFFVSKQQMREFYQLEPRRLPEPAVYGSAYEISHATCFN